MFVNQLKSPISNVFNCYIKIHKSKVYAKFCSIIVAISFAFHGPEPTVVHVHVIIWHYNYGTILLLLSKQWVMISEEISALLHLWLPHTPTPWPSVGGHEHTFLVSHFLAWLQNLARCYFWGRRRDGCNYVYFLGNLSLPQAKKYAKGIMLVQLET